MPGPGRCTGTAGGTCAVIVACGFHGAALVGLDWIAWIGWAVWVLVSFGVVVGFGFPWAPSALSCQEVLEKPGTRSNHLWFRTGTQNTGSLRSSMSENDSYTPQ